MMDAVLKYQAKAKNTSDILEKYQLNYECFYLATIHRPSNTDERCRLSAILESFAQMDFPVIFPVHPRTLIRIKEMELNHYLAADSIQAITPVSYLDMLMLESYCRAVITDSGGIQKEAYMLGKPCFTLRNETEWKETVDFGWNQLVQPENLNQLIANFIPPTERPSLYGQGDATTKIAELLLVSTLK